MHACAAALRPLPAHYFKIGRVHRLLAFNVASTVNPTTLACTHRGTMVVLQLPLR